MKITSYKQRDINRVIKVYDAMGLILESAKKNNIDLESLGGFNEFYPFKFSLDVMRARILKGLHTLNSNEQAVKEKLGWHAHGDTYEGMQRNENRWRTELEHGESISPYKYHLPTDKVHAKYSIVKFIWYIYEQFLLATIHESTAEVFSLCGLNVSERRLKAIHEWHRAVANANGLPSQAEKTTRIKPRKQWSLEARKRHSKLMTQKNRERARKSEGSEAVY